jgi:putative oxidoreductase
MPLLDHWRSLCEISKFAKYSREFGNSRSPDLVAHAQIRPATTPGEEFMAIQSTPSSHSTFSGLDGVAANATDVWLLIGRVALAWVFVAIGWSHILNPAGLAAYLTSLKAPAPELLAWIGLILEVVISITLVFGVATRYGAVVGIVFLIVATGFAHRYWEYTGPAVGAQYNNFLKNLSILGGMLYVFVIGPGRFSLDAMMRKQ